MGRVVGWRAAGALLGCLAAAGCSGSGGHPAVPVTETVTVTTSAAASTSAATTTPALTTTTSAGPGAIDKVEITTTDQGGGRIGPDHYQLRQVYSWNEPFVNVAYGWASSANATQVFGHECTVVMTTTGPNGYTNTSHSDSCSQGTGVAGAESLTVHAPGTYTITVAVTPQTGAAVTGTKDFDVIPMDEH